MAKHVSSTKWIITVFCIELRTTLFKKSQCWLCDRFRLSPWTDTFWHQTPGQTDDRCMPNLLFFIQPQWNHQSGAAYHRCLYRPSLMFGQQTTSPTTVICSQFSANNSKFTFHAVLPLVCVESLSFKNTEEGPGPLRSFFLWIHNCSTENS